MSNEITTHEYFDRVSGLLEAAYQASARPETSLRTLYNFDVISP